VKRGIDYVSLGIEDVAYLGLGAQGRRRGGPLGPAVRPGWQPERHLTLEPPVEEDVVVSQENGAAFRAWMGR